MKLWLVRHARPLIAPGTCYGATDVPADARETDAAAASLAAALPRGLAVASSPLRRCAQLAQALQGLRPDLAWRPDPRLAEMDFGAWEGQAWDAIGRREIDRWTADFARHRCGGGESVDDLLARTRQALAEAVAAGADALWITHAGVGRAVQVLVQGVTVQRAEEWPRAGLAFGEATWVELAPTGTGGPRENVEE